MSTKNTKDRKPLPPHWYKYYWGECPLCGRDKSYKERIYGERPEDINERHVEIPDNLTYDWCDVGVY